MVPPYAQEKGMKSTSVGNGDGYPTMVHADPGVLLGRDTAIDADLDRRTAARGEIRGDSLAIAVGRSSSLT